MTHIVSTKGAGGAIIWSIRPSRWRVAKGMTQTEEACPTHVTLEMRRWLPVSYTANLHLKCFVLQVDNLKMRYAVKP